NEGLVTVTNGSAAVTSAMLMSRDEWQSMQPSTMCSGQYNSRYFTSYHYSDNQFNQHEGTLIFDFTGEQPFIIRTEQAPQAYYYDMPTGKLYYLLDRYIYEYDAPGSVNSMQYWKSKEFVLPRPVNFGAILLEADPGMTQDELDAREAQ